MLEEVHPIATRTPPGAPRTTPAPPRRRLRAPRVPLTGFALTIAGLVAGCSGMSAIDRRINSMLEQESARLDGGTVPPAYSFSEDGFTRRPDDSVIDPETRNPPASGLEFESAPPDRDVGAALDAYADINPEGALRLDLPESFRLAQTSAREYINEEEEYILAAIRLLIERHLWDPRFFNDTTVGINGGFDSSIDTPLSIINELRATKRLPYGGEIEARWVVSATEQLRAAATDDYVQSSVLILEGNIPLLRGAGLVAREDLIQAERDLVYAARDFERFRRSFLVDIANDYFDLSNQLASIRNQERSLASLEQSSERTRAQVEAGKRPAADQRRFQQSVLSARSTLINLRERYIISLDRFKIRLGLPVETAVIIEPLTIEVPEPAASPTEAAQIALQYRLDLQNTRDRVQDSRRRVANARNNLLPDLDLAADISTGTDPNEDEPGIAFEFDDTVYGASVTFGLPLDREIERLNLRSSIIGLQRQQRNYEVARDNVVLDARAARRNIDQQRFSILLAERRVQDNELLIEELKLKEGDPFDITQAEDDLLQAENDRDRSIQALRSAILEYLLATGQMRVQPNGRFQPLPGMPDPEAAGADQPANGPGTP
ncbi:MAG: TolC family protein [Phycisphaerales bacterium]